MTTTMTMRMSTRMTTRMTMRTAIELSENLDVVTCSVVTVGLLTEMWCANYRRPQRGGRMRRST